MDIEYEEFETVEDVFLYMSAATAPIKNTMPMSTYRGYLMSFIPLNPATGGSYLMIYTKHDLEPGIYEFDVSTKSYKPVKSIERTDKTYFVILAPKRNTIAEAAIKNL